VVLIEAAVVVEEMNGVAVQWEEIYLVEEVIHLPEVADSNIRQQAMTLDPSIIQVMFND